MGGLLQFAGWIVAPVLALGLAHAYTEQTGRSIELGSVKIGAAPEIKDPFLKRCKQIRSDVAGYGEQLRAVQIALSSAMQHTQEKEVELIRIEREDEYKYRTDGIHRNTNRSGAIAEMRSRYYDDLHRVESRLEYVVDVWNYILQGCGLPQYEEAGR